MIGNSGSKLRALIELTRFEHGLMVVLAIVIGALSSGELPLNINLALASLSGLLVEIGIFTLNDYLNVAEDSVNKPWRPIVRGDVSKGEALMLSSIALCSAPLISLPLLFDGLTYAFAILITALVLGLAYDVKLKKLPLIGHCSVAFSTALPFMYGSYLARGPTPLTLSFFILAFLASLSREIIKGVQDIEGDRRAGIKSLAVLYGPSLTLKYAFAIMVIAIVMSPLPLLFIRNRIAYMLMITPSDYLLARASLIALRSPKGRDLERSRRLSLIGMGLGMVAFLIASL
ncbi:MAG: hypothetical protein B6U69_03775 [Thermofilum sp. ex4484_15]|nr:MAG: hypothetical protein B6U69_03775 [Thermofilum sp. ex4484_15]